MRIGIAPRAETPPMDVVASLLECHERIRQFVDLASRLAVVEASDEDRAEAASSVVRYFSVGLPLHSEDEDVSIAPRLQRFGASGEVLDATLKMVEEHRPIGALVKTLLPQWGDLAARPGSFARLAGGLVEGADRLRDLIEPHLVGEENLVLSAIPTVLPPIEIGRILQEMRDRRTPR